MLLVCLLLLRLDATKCCLLCLARSLAECVSVVVVVVLVVVYCRSAWLHIVQRKPKDIVLHKEANAHRLEHKGLNIRMRLIIIGLHQYIRYTKHTYIYISIYHIHMPNHLCSWRTHCSLMILTCRRPSTLIKTPPSNVGCESTVVITRVIFWKLRLCGMTTSWLHLFLI